VLARGRATAASDEDIARWERRHARDSAVSARTSPHARIARLEAQVRALRDLVAARGPA